MKILKTLKNIYVAHDTYMIYAVTVKKCEYVENVANMINLVTETNVIIETKVIDRINRHKDYNPHTSFFFFFG